MRVVMSLSPEGSENVLIFHINLDLLGDERGLAKWFGAHYNKEEPRAVSHGVGAILLNFITIQIQYITTTRALNDDLPSTLTSHQVAEAGSRENIICNMASGSLIGQFIFDLVSAT